MLYGLAAIIGACLYRARGGWLKDLGWTTSSWVGSIFWAIPTGALIGGLIENFLLALALIVTTIASHRLYGHGAHMIYGPAYFQHVKVRTELLTQWWLEKLFGGLPDKSWPQWRVDLCNVIGMSFIGLVRHITLAAPLFWFAPGEAAIFALTGLLHGPIYRLGWYITPDIRAAEFLVGAMTWVTIVTIWR